MQNFKKKFNSAAIFPEIHFKEFSEFFAKFLKDFEGKNSISEFFRKFKRQEGAENRGFFSFTIMSF